MKVTTKLTVMFLCLFTGIILHGSTYFVDSSQADDSGDGLSWANAKQSIQAAIDAANISGVESEVWVKSGVYKPDDASSSFILKHNVKLYGGFSGSETSINDRDAANNHTILSGDINGDDKWIDNWGIVADGATQQGLIVDNNSFTTPESGWILDVDTASDNCSMVVSIPADSDATTTIDGFIVTGGCVIASGSGSTQMYASGIRVEDDNSILTISNCIISGNATSFTGSSYAVVHGVGIGCPEADNTITVDNCTIRANNAEAAVTSGTIFVKGVGLYNVDAQLTCTNSTISDNMAEITGTADNAFIYAVGCYNNRGTLSFSDNSFNGNNAVLEGNTYVQEYGIGLCNDDGHNSTISNCTISDNTVTLTALQCAYSFGIGIHNDAQNVTFDNCTVSNNSSTNTGGKYTSCVGGGIFIGGSGCKLNNLTVSNNNVTLASDTEYTRCYGAGICISDEYISLTNSLISSNSVTATSNCTDNTEQNYFHGAGVYLGRDKIEVINCTITGNSASVTSPDSKAIACGGGVFMDSTNQLVANCTITDNSITASSDAVSAEAFGGGVYANQATQYLANNILINGAVSATTSTGTATEDGENLNVNEYADDGGSASAAIVAYCIIPEGYTGTGIITTDPELGALADNEGTTQTMAIGSDSSAKDAGIYLYQDDDDNSTYFYSIDGSSDYLELADDSSHKPNSTENNLNSIDQRGASRFVAGRADIGAYEYVGSTVTITFSDPGESGSISGDTTQTVDYWGSTTAVEAIPNTNFEFTCWSGDFTSTDNPLTLTNISSDMTIYAIFDRTNYTPEISAISATPANMILPGTSTSTLSVTATDQDNDTLTYTWTKNSGPDGVTFDSTNGTSTGASCVATFTQEGTYELQVTVDDGTDSASATVSVTVIDSSRAIVTSVSSLSVNEGLSGSFTVTLDSAPDFETTITVATDGSSIITEGSTLTFDSSNWNIAQTVSILTQDDDSDTNDSTETITLDSDYATSAQVALTIVDDDFTLTLQVSGSGSTLPAVGEHILDKDDAPFIIVASADTDYVFANWSGDATGIDSILSLAAPDTNEVSLTANFELDKETALKLIMAVSPANSGSTTPECDSTTYFLSGQETTLSATTSDGYYFVGWKADPMTNASFADANSASTTVTVTGSVTVTAKFSAVPIEKAILTMAIDPAGTGTTSPAVGETIVNTGIAQNITATAETGYKFISWVATGNAAINDYSDSSTKVTLTGDATVTAMFVNEDVTTSELTIDKFKVTMDSSKENKDSVKVTMQQPEGFEYDNINDDLKLQVGSWNVIVPAASLWKVTKNQIYTGFVESGITKVCINNQKQAIAVSVTQASLAGTINTSNEVNISLTVGNNIYLGSCNPNDKTSWKFVSSKRVDGFTANVKKFTGANNIKNEAEIANYTFQVSGTILTDPTTNGYSTDFSPKVYLGEAEWDFSEIIPKEKNNKFIYSYKEGTQTLYLCLDFNKGKWSFKAIDKESDFGKNVNKGETVRFILSLESDSETLNSVNDVITSTKTTLKK